MLEFSLFKARTLFFHIKYKKVKLSKIHGKKHHTHELKIPFL